MRSNHRLLGREGSVDLSRRIVGIKLSLAALSLIGRQEDKQESRHGDAIHIPYTYHTHAIHMPYTYHTLKHGYNMAS